jgi:hypothetical protein
MRDTAAAYSAVALSRMGRTIEATSTLKAAEEAWGATEVLQAAHQQIEKGAPFASAPSLAPEDDPIQRIKSALHDLVQLDHVSQAEVLRPRPSPFGALVTDYVRAAAGSVVALVPMMKGVKIDSIEDDLTAFIRELLASRIQHLGWSLADQSKGGFTASGNPGERDLILMQAGTTIAVIEAVVCRNPVTWETTQKQLRDHFQRLLAYSTCRLFFHLTYAYIPSWIKSEKSRRMTRPPVSPSSISRRSR